jgi:hypothetical protein
MATPQTVMLPVDISYTDNDGAAKVRRCFLNLSLSIADVNTETVTLQEQGLGEITIQGAVMPIDDHPQATQTVQAVPAVNEGEALEEAA